MRLVNGAAEQQSKQNVFAIDSCDLVCKNSQTDELSMEPEFHAAGGNDMTVYGAAEQQNKQNIFDMV